MPDKVSFTDFGEKKKHRKMKRNRKPRSEIDEEKLLDDVLAAKKLAEDTIQSSGPGMITLPFIEVFVNQSGAFLKNQWNELELTISNTGNGGAKTVTISFDNLLARGQTIIDTINSGEDVVLDIEVKSQSIDKKISRMDVYYHSIEGDTFTLIRRDWFPNEKDNELIFENEIPDGEDPNSSIYQHREVVHSEFHVLCSKCGARSPSNFRICGKCGSRLQKRVDRHADWGSNRRETTSIEDERELLVKKLRKLGELKDQGMLSDDEFTVAKSKLLK